MKPFLIGFFLLVTVRAALGQFQVDRPVELIGPAPGERRLEGVANSLDPAHAAAAGVAQSGGANLTATIAGNAWDVQLTALGSEPADGTYLVLRVPAASASPITITLNGQGPLPLLWDGAPVTGDALIEGRMLSVVLGNNAFHLLNGTNDRLRECPSGLVAVNEQYCVELNERPPGNYFEAGLACAANGLRLCSWAEFVAACQRGTELQLALMTNSWEWTSSTSNEDNSARIAGLNGCDSAGNWLSTGSAPVAFRCCFTR